jgi:hypothetical protein
MRCFAVSVLLALVAVVVVQGSSLDVIHASRLHGQEEDATVEYESAMRQLAREQPTQWKCLEEVSDDLIKEACILLSEEAGRRIAMQLSNCDLSNRGRETYECTPSMSELDCIRPFDDPENLYLHQLYLSKVQLGNSVCTKLTSLAEKRMHQVATEGLRQALHAARESIVDKFGGLEGMLEHQALHAKQVSDSLEKSGDQTEKIYAELAGLRTSSSELKEEWTELSKVTEEVQELQRLVSEAPQNAIAWVDWKQVAVCAACVVLALWRTSLYQAFQLLLTMINGFIVGNAAVPALQYAIAFAMPVSAGQVWVMWYAFMSATAYYALYGGAANQGRIRWELGQLRMAVDGIAGDVKWMRLKQNGGRAQEEQHEETRRSSETHKSAVSFTTVADAPTAEDAPAPPTYEDTVATKRRASTKKKKSASKASKKGTTKRSSRTSKKRS